MKITIKDLISIIEFHKTLLEEGTKLEIAYNTHNRIKINKILEEHLNEPLSMKRLDLCLCGKDGEVLKDEKGEYKFTKDSIKELTIFSKELNKKEIEIDFFTVKFEKMSENQKQIICSKDEKGEYHLRAFNVEHENLLSKFITGLPKIKQENEE